MWQGIVAVAAVTLALWAEPIWHQVAKPAAPVSVYIPGGYPWSPVCKLRQLPISRECVLEKAA